ncbi:unnamed protein product [Meloidogyne enterolobii]|uniref:Uncharacterized protein n=1 Tax=Meloidogyne enterolobii TaxID=390850 RepID=A0ACB1B2H1_MELEN
MIFKNDVESPKIGETRRKSKGETRRNSKPAHPLLYPRDRLGSGSRTLFFPGSTTQIKTFFSVSLIFP